MTSMLLLALVLIEVAIWIRLQKAVKGSHQRYILATWRVIFGWSIGIFAFILFFVNMAQGQSFIAAIDLIIVVQRILYEKKYKDEDDNWFNGRGKKIWKSIKTTVSSFRLSPASTM